MPNSLDKGKEDKKNRAELSRQFYEMGIVRCEMCNGGSYLSFAHSLKRNDIEREDLELRKFQMKEVALLCVPCHQKIERLPKEEMKEKILEIIRNRQERIDAIKYGL